MNNKNDEPKKVKKDGGEKRAHNDTDKHQSELNTKNKAETEKDPQVKLGELQQKLDHVTKQWQLAVADKENLKFTAQKDISDAKDYAITNFARDIIGCIDNLERFLENISEGDSLQVGIKMAWEEFINTLKRYSIERVYPIGQKFDHNLHQAIAEELDATKEHGTVLKVMQAGYKIKDRLLRAAIVVTSKSE